MHKLPKTVIPPLKQIMPSHFPPAKSLIDPAIVLPNSCPGALTRTPNPTRVARSAWGNKRAATTGRRERNMDPKRP